MLIQRCDRCTVERRVAWTSAGHFVPIVMIPGDRWEQQGHRDFCGICREELTR